MPFVALLAGVMALPATAQDARTSIPGGMCSLWTTKQASSAMKEPMKVVREDPDYCVWYSKKDHSGNISTLSARLAGGDASSDLSLLEQARAETWRNWTSEDTVDGVPVLMTDVRRFGKNREIDAAAFPDDVTWLDVNATSVIGANVRTAVKRMVGVAAPAFAVEPATSPAASVPVPVETGSAPSPSDGPAQACALLTTEEVAAVIGETVRIGVDDPGQCILNTPGGTILQVIILTPGANQTVSMLERRKADSPDATPYEIGGYPALFEIGPLLGVPSVYVYPSDFVELELELVTPSEIDARAVLTGLAEVAVGRLVEAGLPVAPTPVPTQEPGTGLCSILSADEASVALGGAPIAQTLSEADGCAHLADGSSSAVSLEILRDDRAASVRDGMSQVSERFDLAGMPAGQQDMPPGSIVVLLPDDATAVMLTLGGPEGLDAHANARALAELVAPRVRTYLGLSS
jgi:hypothetical protein